MVGLQEPEALHINVQVHLLLDVGIAGAEGLDLRIGQGGFVDVLRRAHRAFAGHDLPDEFLLALHQLIEVAVKGVFCDIGVDVHLVILVALPDDPALPLLEVGGPPGTVQVVQRREFLLNIGAGSHLLGGADQHPDLPRAHLAKQLLFLRLRIRGVDIGDFFGWYAPGDQLIPQVIIDVEIAVPLGGGQVAKGHLRGPPGRGALPDGEDIVGAGVDLSGIAVREQGVEEPLVQGQLAPVVGNEQHIVLGAVHHSVADLLRPLSQCRHHLLLLF